MSFHSFFFRRASLLKLGVFVKFLIKKKKLFSSQRQWYLARRVILWRQSWVEWFHCVSVLERGIKINIVIVNDLIAVFVESVFFSLVSKTKNISIH